MSGAELFAVTGRPVGHSLSPEIFRLLFRSFGLAGVYTRLAADSAREALGTARAIGLRGLNVTSPFKEEVVPYLDGLDEHVPRIGAANCLVINGAGAFGYNTDFSGSIAALYSEGVSPEQRIALVLGAGGAARAAAYGLIQSKAKRVILASRSLDRAKASARDLGCDYAPLDEAGTLLEEADICISCLPFPVSRILPDFRRSGALVVDANYGPAASFRSPEEPCSATGLKWLFCQAIPSFEIFTGLEVPKGLERTVWEDFRVAERPRRPNIALVGFMGCGKTATGRRLAGLLGCDLLDTDEAVTSSTGMTIPEIFELQGEGAFRALEKSALEKCLSGGKGKVISVGGGAVLDEANRRLLTEHCRVVWLWASARTAVSRIDPASRPVLSSHRPAESAGQILAARIPLYAAISDIIVNSEAGDVLQVARRIKDEMDQAI